MSDQLPQPENLRDARRQLSERWAEALTVCCATVGTTSGGDRPGRQIPILHVDARPRPEVMDLPRVLGSEGVAAVIYIGWQFMSPEVHPGVRGFMTWEMQRPVACAFEVAVEVRHWRPALQAVAAEGVVGIATGWPCPAAVGFAPGTYVVMPTSAIGGLLKALAWTQEDQ